MAKAVPRDMNVQVAEFDMPPLTPIRVLLRESADWAGGASIAIGRGAAWSVAMIESGLLFEHEDGRIFWVPNSGVRWVMFEKGG